MLGTPKVLLVQTPSSSDQTFLLTGVGRQLSETLELSLLALTGPFAKGDRLGLMAAVTWDHQLW
jgi:hypothetical protein